MMFDIGNILNITPSKVILSYFADEIFSVRITITDVDGFKLPQGETA